MSKLCMIRRELRRDKLIKKYAARREELRALKGDPDADRALQLLPRDSTKCRARRRCHLTGRARGNYRRFGICRNKLRQAVMSGMVPGIKKASW